MDGDAEEDYTAASAARAARSLKSLAAKNLQQRAVHAADPASYVNSEVDLDQQLRALQKLGVAAPAALEAFLYGAAGLATLVELVGHANPDIGAAAIGVLNEILDEADGSIYDVEDGPGRLAAAASAAGLPSLLADGFLPAVDEFASLDDYRAVGCALRLIDNLVAAAAEAGEVANLFGKNLLLWLLRRILTEEDEESRAVDRSGANRLTSAEILAVFLQASEKWRGLLVDSGDGGAGGEAGGEADGGAGARGEARARNRAASGSAGSVGLLRGLNALAAAISKSARRPLTSTEGEFQCNLIGCFSTLLLQKKGLRAALGEAAAAASRDSENPEDVGSPSAADKGAASVAAVAAASGWSTFLDLLLPPMIERLENGSSKVVAAALRCTNFLLEENAEACDLFVELGGLRPLFAALTRPRAAGAAAADVDAHGCAALLHLFERAAPAAQARLLAAFNDAGGAAVARLAAVHAACLARVRAALADGDGAVRNIHEALDLDQDEEAYLAACASGLDTLQSVDRLLLHVACSGSTLLLRRVQYEFARRKIPHRQVATVVETIFLYNPDPALERRLQEMVDFFEASFANLPLAPARTEGAEAAGEAAAEAGAAGGHRGGFRREVTEDAAKLSERPTSGA